MFKDRTWCINSNQWEKMEFFNFSSNFQIWEIFFLNTLSIIFIKIWNSGLLKDRNLSINKFIRESRDSVNQNDTWHCVKAMKTSLTKISAGTLHDKGKTWSFQLTDKVETVATHVHWCIRNCNNEKDELRSSLLNIVDHYKNIHTSCHESSRCRKDNLGSPPVFSWDPCCSSF